MHSLPGSWLVRCAHAAPAASAAAEAVWLPCHGAGAFSPIMALSHSTPGLAPAADGAELVRPATDDLLYRFVTLPNGLHALLVSDATADKAAAAVDVSGRRERVLGGAVAAARALQGPPRAAVPHDRGAGRAGQPLHPPIALGRPPTPAAAARALVPAACRLRFASMPCPLTCVMPMRLVPTSVLRVGCAMLPRSPLLHAGCPFVLLLLNRCRCGWAA